jgi:hypothetical protein
MGGGHVAIDIALPDVHGHRDVLQPEPPVRREEPKVLRPGLTGRRRGCLSALSETMARSLTERRARVH